MMYGEQGWAWSDEINECLDKAVDGNHNPEKVDIQRLVGLDHLNLMKLASRVPERQFGDQQNYAPTFGQFVELSKKYPRMTFHGYRVNPKRVDERITIEGWHLPVEDRDDFLDDICSEHSVDESDDYDGIWRTWWD